MRRKHRIERKYEPDLVYQSPLVTRFINYIMKDGKKTIARKIFYQAMELIKKETKEDPLAVFNSALKNVAPELEVKSRRIGGANYQIPQHVAPYRQFTLACRWLLGAARSKKGASFAKGLAEELISASHNEGNAIKKKLNVQRMAEANKAFARFAHHSHH